MASLKDFARRMARIGRNVERNADRLAVDTASAVGQTVVLATPVDTGRARGNWQASLGGGISEEKETEDPAGQRTIAENNETFSARKGRASLHLSNNVPYIGELNDGSSAQAPANFVEEAVQAGIRGIERARLTRDG